MSGIKPLAYYDTANSLVADRSYKFTSRKIPTTPKVKIHKCFGIPRCRVTMQHLAGSVLCVMSCIHVAQEIGHDCNGVKRQ